MTEGKSEIGEYVHKDTDETVTNDCILAVEKGNDNVKISVGKLGNGKKQKKKRTAIGDYEWIEYEVGQAENREINYIRDYLKKHKGSMYNKTTLGLEDDMDNTIFVHTNSDGNKLSDADSKQPADGDGSIGKRKPASSNGGGHAVMGTKKLMDVATSLEERLVKYGRLNEDGNVIKRKVHNNFDFYEQDDFIDDPNDDQQVQASMEIVYGRFDDYVMIKGGIEAMKKHKKYMERQGETRVRNRENKVKKNEEMKKKRDEMQYTHLKKTANLLPMASVAMSGTGEVEKKEPEAGVGEDTKP